jgi:hypothetical protein
MGWAQDVSDLGLTGPRPHLPLTGLLAACSPDAWVSRATGCLTEGDLPRQLAAAAGRGHDEGSAFMVVRFDAHGIGFTGADAGHEGERPPGATSALGAVVKRVQHGLRSGPLRAAWLNRKQLRPRVVRDDFRGRRASYR